MKTFEPEFLSLLQTWFQSGFPTDFVRWILSFLLNSLWQIPLLFAAGWFATRLLRPLGAAAEHRVWATVLMLQTLLPAVSALSWNWPSLLFAWSSAPHRPGEGHVSVTMGAGTALAALPLSAQWLAAMAIAYAAVFAYFAARFLWRLRRLRALRREAVPVDLTGEAALCWQRCARQFGIDHAQIAASSLIFGPVTIGVARKLMLLPATMVFSSLPETDIRTVIAHEFAHMRRNDFLKNLLCELLSLPVSYHPVVWLTRERVMESREILCDHMAAVMEGRHQYARSLLRLASLLLEGVPARTPHTIGIFDANALERRLMKLTEKQAVIGGAHRLAIVAICAALGLGTCASALALHMHVDGLAASSRKASPPTAPIAVSASVMAGQRIDGPMPKYPPAAKKARIQGAVVLDAVIGKDGQVQNLRVVSGPKELQESSLDAVKQWTYKPFLLNGNPVEVKTTINVIYSLAK